MGTLLAPLDLLCVTKGATALSATIRDYNPYGMDVYGDALLPP
jgi:hypothetical protein